MLLLAACLCGPPASAAPQRIVSLSVCTDQLLQALVDRRRIRALSFLAVDPLTSAAAKDAEGLPLVHAAAEEVLSLDADLVILDAYTSTATVAMLRRLGRDVLSVPYASSFGELYIAIDTIAAAVGEAGRGRAMIAELEQRLARVAASVTGTRPTALVYQVNGLTAGRGSLSDAVLTAAGYRNLAGERGLAGDAALPLEALVANPPQLIILDATPDTYRSVAADNLRHPALRQLIERVATVQIAAPLWLCANPRTIEVVEQLAALRARIGGRR